MCFSCICLFILHALIFFLFLFLLVSGVGGGFCTVLLLFLKFWGTASIGIIHETI